jgi:hypothetical protein
MIIECPHCEAKTECVERGSVDVDLEYVSSPTKYVLLECKICKAALLGITEIIQTGQDEWEWDPPRRLWPVPETSLDDAIPDLARVSLVEAKVCFKAHAYSACAVMCGRAIEGVCMHHDPSTQSLANGLKRLRDAGLIDDRIFRWGEALRVNRNLGAHATTEKVTRADAQDLLDFSLAICEYVFVLHEKFERFEKRRAKLASPAVAGAVPSATGVVPPAPSATPPTAPAPSPSPSKSGPAAGSSAPA